MPMPWSSSHPLAKWGGDKVTTSKWAKLAKCSQDTAYRDILALIAWGALGKAEGAGRSTHYALAMPTDEANEGLPLSDNPH